MQGARSTTRCAPFIPSERLPGAPGLRILFAREYFRGAYVGSRVQLSFFPLGLGPFGRGREMSEDAEAFETRTESHQGEISILAGRELESLSAVKTSCVLFGIFAVMCAARATTTTAATPPPTSAPLTASSGTAKSASRVPASWARGEALQPGERLVTLVQIISIRTAISRRDWQPP